ncbi:MAG: cell envelope integrity EipB family protein [Candidatus Paracaedibacteraceae bacterium]|nr:cell envelope integrity EipB family protein [Candidatus Paracaedibacteraceae bacterium]
MHGFLRIALILFITSSAVVAEPSSPPPLWQSFKNHWPGSKVSTPPVKTEASYKDKKQTVDPEAPSFGVWGTLNRFFQAASSTPQPPLKTTSKTEINEIASQKAPPPPLPEKTEQAVYTYQQAIVPHKARYTIKLEKNYGDDISDATGEMAINIYDTGDGLVFEQNSTLIIYNGDGEGELIITNLATWQTYDGKRYRFNSRTVRNGEQEEVIKGEALKDDAERITRVTYSRPTTSQVITPYETVFPLHHLIHCLEMAKAGKSVVSDVVFDGSSETHEAVNVDTLLGPAQPTKLKIITDQNILNKNQWPMRLAVYAPGSKSPEPDYEMEQKVLDSGVVEEMTLDYGAFQVKAILEKIDFYATNKSPL